MTRRDLLVLLALALPLAVLGLCAAVHAWHRAYAPAYTVAIEGYDPRDLVYGEYMQFRLLWDDARSERPAGADDLPESARMYLPEGNAWDLQTMLWDRSSQFHATVSVMGNRVFVRTLSIDGRPWQEGLAAWRQNRNNQSQ